ncbi:hypothetical protein LBMAG42_55280 [Deltaproteobacteria bacterium]|nr:hypothetical protein LBMAG42_55280 [Deltaproteobacteria bacterium]
MRNVLITGATGSLGGPVAEALLARGDRVACLVRPRPGESAQARLEAAGLASATAIEGELGGRLGAVGKQSWDVVVHCASDRTPFPRSEGAQRRLNVDGPVELMLAARSPTFIHVSSAWVAGARSGVALESEVDVGQAFHTSTQESLLEGEVAARQHAKREGVDLRVARPGWVIGGDECLSAFAGLVANLAWRTRHSRSQLRVPGLKGARMPLAPRAWVCASIAALVDADAASNSTVHLVAQGPTQDAFFARLADRAAFPGLRVYTPRRGPLKSPTRIESQAHALLGPMFDTLATDLVFDDREARRVLGPRGLAPLDLQGTALLEVIDSLLER